MRDIKCPYCNADNDVNHDDGYGYEENTLHQQECGNCGKIYTYTTSISFYYESHKADCLNDGKHNYQPTITCPKFFTKMRCRMCGDERTPTDEERRNFNIPFTYENKTTTQ